MTRRPLVRRQETAIALGIGFFLLGSYLLYDAWEGRGGNTPRLLRPITWW
jgi:hypothetical protein